MAKNKKTEKVSYLEYYRNKPCLICKRPSDPCHVRSRGSGGSDEHWNLISLCRIHHTEQHTMTWFKFCEKYPVIKYILESKGWEFEDSFGIMKLRRKQFIETDLDHN